MPRLSEGQVAIGALVAFSAWIFIGLPWLNRLEGCMPVNFTGIAPLIGAFGQFLGGLGLIVASITGLITLRKIHQRTLDNQWAESFRNAYAEFWKDEIISKVRKQIVNDKEYSVLEAIIKKRLASPRNDLNSEDNNALECVDKFCALMYRIASFANPEMTGAQRDAWEYLYEDYWLEEMIGREQLRRYIKRFWPRLDEYAEKWVEKARRSQV